jgi:hypothetical protein
MPRALRARLVAEAKARGVSVSRLVRLAVLKLLQGGFDGGV